MIINSMNSVNANCLNFGAKKSKPDQLKFIDIITSKNHIKSLTDSVLALAMSDSFSASKNESKVSLDEMPQTEIKDDEKENNLIPEQEENKVSVVEQVLKSGVKKQDKISSDSLSGTIIDTTLTPPVKGISRIKTHKFVNGDLSEIKTFDEQGNQKKNILYEHNYMRRRKPESILVMDDNGRVTTIHFSYLLSKPNNVKSVTIETPNGETKTKVIEQSVKDKITDKIISLKENLY